MTRMLWFCAILPAVMLSVIGEYFHNGLENKTRSVCEDIFRMDIYSLVRRLRWDKFVILYISNDILRPLNDNIQAIVYDLSVNDTFITLHEIHNALSPEINVIASMKQRHFTRLMNTVTDVDRKSMGMTDFQYHSKWVLFVEDLNIQEFQDSVGSMANVAVAVRMCTSATVQYLTLQRHPTGSALIPVKQCPGENQPACYFPDAVYGYHNKQLSVGIVKSVGYVEKVVSNGTAFYRGYAVDILQILAETLNFSYILSEPQAGAWGLPVNGTYDGLVGQLYRREIDIAACDLTIDIGRSQHMEYVYPPIYTDSIVVLYMKHDSSPSDSIFLLAGPFQPVVYLLVLVWTCVLPLLLAVVESRALDKKSIKINASNVKSQIFIYCWDVIGSMLKQGFCKQPSTTPGKVLLSSWWMALLVLTSAYSANLIASLSTQNSIRPFSNLEELLDSDYTIGIRVTGLSHTFLKTSSKSSLLGRLWARIMQNDLEVLQYDLDVHVQRVKRDQYAFMTFRTYAERQMAADCRLGILDERITWEHQSFGVQQKSPIKADIQNVMSKLRENGILDKLWRKWNPVSNTKNCSPEKTVNGISNTQLGGGYIAVGLGITLSCVVLCIEKLKYFSSRTKQK